MKIPPLSPRIVQVILGSLCALTLVISPAVAQHKGGGNGHTDHGNGNGNGHEKHHDRSNPKPPKDDKGDKDKDDKGKGDKGKDDKGKDDKGKSAKFSIGSVPGATTGSAVALPAAGTRMITALRARTLTTASGRTLPAESQQTVLAALSPDGTGEVLPLMFALTSNGNEHAKKQAGKLVKALPGAYDSPESLTAAVKAFNSLVDASSAQFLMAPPARVPDRPGRAGAGGAGSRRRQRCGVLTPGSHHIRAAPSRGSPR